MLSFIKSFFEKSTSETLVNIVPLPQYSKVKSYSKLNEHQLKIMRKTYPGFKELESKRLQVEKDTLSYKTKYLK